MIQEGRLQEVPSVPKHVVQLLGVHSALLKTLSLVPCAHSRKLTKAVKDSRWLQRQGNGIRSPEAGVKPFPETSVSTHTCIIQIYTHINKEKANL